MTAPTWIPYNAAHHGGFCEVCRAPATWVLVKLYTGIALDLLRIVCDLHRPGDPAEADPAGAELHPGEPRRARPSGRRRAP